MSYHKQSTSRTDDYESYSQNSLRPQTPNEAPIIIDIRPNIHTADYSLYDMSDFSNNTLPHDLDLEFLSPPWLDTPAYISFDNSDENFGCFQWISSIPTENQPAEYPNDDSTNILRQVQMSHNSSSKNRPVISPSLEIPQPEIPNRHVLPEQPLHTTPESLTSRIPVTKPAKTSSKQICKYCKKAVVGGDGKCTTKAIGDHINRCCRGKNICIANGCLKRLNSKENFDRRCNLFQHLRLVHEWIIPRARKHKNAS